MAPGQGYADSVDHSSVFMSCHTQNEAPSAPSRRAMPMKRSISAPLGWSMRPPTSPMPKACPMTCTGLYVASLLTPWSAAAPGSSHSQYIIGA